MEVINVKTGSCTHYCGRKTSYKGNGVDYSILGNPFSEWQYGREGCIEMFRKYLNKEMRANSEVWQAVADLPEDAKLGCFCYPQKCHCDVIVRAWQWNATRA